MGTLSPQSIFEIVIITLITNFILNIIEKKVARKLQEGTK